MKLTKNEIITYLDAVKQAIENNNYQIERNIHRQDNNNIFWNYLVDEAKAKQILLSLTFQDFSCVKKNHKVGYEHERLYVFGKEVELLERVGENKRRVSLYIKINQLENQYVIVVSFHEQKYQLSYYFK